ncbi:MAG: hemoblobin-interacting domain-containing protein [Paludibacter sp.]
MKQFKLTFLVVALMMVLSNVGWGQTTHLVISQVYGGGGNAGAIYKNDFIEIFNPTNSPISVNGWSVQYVSAAGNGTWVVTPLSNTSIPAYSYYLVQEAAGTGGTTNLPTPDAIGTIAMSGTTGKVALVNSTTALTGANPNNATVIDLIGWGPTATGYETAPAPILTNTTSNSRLSGGCIDNNNNSTDFVAGSVNPRNSASPINSCSLTPPTLIADNTINNVDNNIDITFTDNSAWRSVITSVKIGGTALTITTDYVITSGNLQLKPSGGNPLLTTSGSKAVTIQATGYSTASVTQIINPGADNNLLIFTQPTAPSVNGGTLGTQPVINIRDQFNNITTSTANVVASVGSGAWTIGGTLTKAGVNGTATFTDLTATSGDAVTGAISFSCGSLTVVTSTPFNIPAPITTIFTGTVSTAPFCVDDVTSASGTVEFTSVGNFFSETFTAYLSDLNGSFSSPISIGSINVTGIDPSGTINISIPAGTTTGTGYKIRIDGTTSSITGVVGTAFTIYNGAQNITGLSATNGNTQSIISWTNPVSCYNEVMIVATNSTFTSAIPSGNGSSYSASLVFGSGTPFDGGFVVYKGITSPETVTNLTNETTYNFKIFTRNGTNWSTGVVTSSTPTSAANGDYRSIATGNWTTFSTWEKFDGSNWVTPATEPATTSSIRIRNGHTVTIDANSKNCKNIIVETGGILLAGTTLARFMNVYGNITCNGTIGNGSTYEYLGFDIEGSSCLISGTGTFDCARIAKNAATNPITDLTIAMNVNCRYNGTLASPTVYVNTANCKLNININSGSSLNLIGNGVNGAGVFSFGNGTVSEKGGNLVVNGSLTISGQGTGIPALYLTNKSTSYPTSVTIGSTGVINVGYLECSASGTGGNTLTINSGGYLNVTGPSTTLSTFSTTNNIFNLNSGSIVEYSYSAIQSVAPLTYSNLVISGGGTKNVVLGNVLVNDGLTLTSGILNAGAYTITLGTSILNLGTLNPAIPTSASYVVGNFERWIPNTTFTDMYFPVGSSGQYRPAIISYTTASSGGKLKVIGYETDPGTINTDTSITEAVTNYVIDRFSKEAWWSFLTSDITGGEYDISFEANAIAGVSVANFGRLRILKRVNSSSIWTLVGDHSPATGSNIHPLVKRIGLTGFSEFGIGGYSVDGNVLNDAPLPVTLASLNSTIINRNIKLNWTTSSEINNSGFEIERKAIDGSFAKIGYVSGNGTVNTPTDYSFEDRNLQTGKYKYRLKQIDNNGNFEYFALNGEVEIGVPKKFDLSQNYPNPFNPVTKINFDLPENGLVNLRLYDMLGREVATLVNEVRTAGYYTVNFNASSLSSGIYFYRMNAGKFSSIKKMAVIK